MDYSKALAEALAPLCNVPATEIEEWFEKPKNPEMGDIAFPCFRLSKTLKKSPVEIANSLKCALTLPEGVIGAEAVAGYLNFRLDPARLSKTVLNEALQKGDAYGGADIGKGKTIVVEYSSINIAKPFHIGHLPTTAIGNSLANIYKALGYNVVRINHLGDWGTQFGKMLCAFEKWGDKPINEYSVKEMVNLYVRFNREAESDASLNEQARAWFRRLEAGDEAAVGLWKQMTSATLNEDSKVYERLNVSFDSYAGEAFYEDKMPAIIEELRETGISKVDQGATIVDLSEWNMPPCIILKSDGSTIYATRDIAAACYRKATYDFDKCLYVVAYQQDLHFRQFFKVLELMGRTWVKDCVHVKFGMVSMEEGTLSTRQGIVVYLEDVLNAAVDKTYEIICRKSPDLEDKRAAAEAVGVGAILWNALYSNRIKDVSFSFAKALNFDGETGPYVQYTHARACSVLRRAKYCKTGEVDYSRLNDPYSQELIKAIEAFPEQVKLAAEKYEPYLVARAVMNICSCFNKFYYEVRIMAEDNADRAARLALTDASRQVIKNGLTLLGLKAPERM
ncbi:MAG: arginine--tRNA ligase [Clostridia bacterium]|nr:arginine--tRNA ligase [Clostridia bacterium]